MTPAEAFDWQFARQVLRRAAESLANECVADGKGPISEAFWEFGTDDEKPHGYEAIATRLGLNSVGTLKSHVSRLRDRYEQLIREHINEIVPRGREVDDEWTELENALWSLSCAPGFDTCRSDLPPENSTG